MNNAVNALTQRVADRFKAGAHVVVLQEADEALALGALVPLAAALEPAVTLSASVPGILDVIAAHAAKDGRGLLIVRDLFAVFGEPMAARIVRDVATQVREDGAQPAKLVLIEQPATRIPPTVASDVEVVASPLPTVAELSEELDGFVEREGITLKGNGQERYALASAVAGLPRHEAALLFGRSKVELGRLDVEWLRTEKARRVSDRLGGLLTFENTDGPDIGGCDVLREWLDVRSRAFASEKARAFGLPSPKGVFLAGTPGSGKSVFAKYAARKLGVPLLRFDVGRAFGGVVGETERNMRMAIEAAEACAPCVLLVDEVDKGFGGTQGAQGDSGTALRAFGSFLTWRAESKSSVFVVATANRAWALPAEFYRRGRFDETFYVGPLTDGERASVLSIHLVRRKWTLPSDDVAALAKTATQFSGAECEAAVVEAGFTAFARGAKRVEVKDLAAAIALTVPIARIAPQDIAAIEDWAKGRARNASSAVAKAAAAQAGVGPVRARVGS